jgi:LacI family transcriptional regulator
VEKLRYVPHGAARSLITRRTHTIGVLLPDLFGEFFSELIRGIDRAARKRGYHLLVSGSHGDRAETREMLRAMRGRVDGLVVLSADLDPRELETNLPAEFPAVLLNSDGTRDYDAIRVDNYGGASALVRHLIGLGHRRIGFVTGPPGNYDATERLRGFRDAMARGGGQPVAEIRGDFREEAGYRAAARVLRARPRPTAVVVANDAMAIGLLFALRERNVRVPEDLALVGFDDIPIARFTTPPLTTVRIPITELGSRATARLLQLVEGGKSRSRRTETLETTLVVRSSCGASADLRASTLPSRASTNSASRAGSES